MRFSYFLNVNKKTIRNTKFNKTTQQSARFIKLILSSVAGIKLFLYPDSLSHDPILQDKSF